MVLVTGSSGHIGNVLVRRLVQMGEDVTLMTRDGLSPSWLTDLNLNVRKANLKDPEAVEHAIQGAEYVFHLAGMISISSFDDPELFDINVKGTQNVIEACVKNGVNRLVYTSSVHALPERGVGEAITEQSDFSGEGLYGAYSRTKAEATRRVLQAVENKGLDAVVCFPSGVMGPNDYRGSEAGKMIIDYAGNKLPMYITGEYNFVDVRDVAEGLILGWKKGTKGEGYILSGEQMSLEQFFDYLEDMHPSMKRPKWKMPVNLAIPLAWVVEFFSKIFGLKPLFTAYAIKVLQSQCLLPSTKAKKELGYEARPIRESISDALD